MCAFVDGLNFSKTINTDLWRSNPLACSFENQILIILIFRDRNRKRATCRPPNPFKLKDYEIIKLFNFYKYRYIGRTNKIYKSTILWKIQWISSPQEIDLHKTNLLNLNFIFR